METETLKEDRPGIESKSTVGGFPLRIVILIVVLLAAVALFIEERYARTARVVAKLDQIETLAKTEEANLSGLTSDQIQNVMGVKPELANDEENGITVESYTFKNRVPFLGGQDVVHVVYNNDSYLKYLLNQSYDLANIEKFPPVYLPPIEDRIPVDPGGLP